jgi:Uma2 family endonuclease
VVSPLDSARPPSYGDDVISVTIAGSRAAGAFAKPRPHMLPCATLPRFEFAEQIMGMPAQREQRRWTEAEFYAARDAAPPGERWELVDGEVLVTPSPHWVHQAVLVRLLELLAPYVRAHSLGQIFVSPLDVKLEPGLVLQPDLLVVPRGELRTREDIVRRLLLAVEVVSPSSARHDRVTKRPKYQKNRVPEYWVLDETSRTIDRWRPDDERPEIIAERLTWHPDGAAAAFVLDLASFFGDVLPSDS